MRALNLLREALHYRRAAFDAGLAACGFQVVRAIVRPTPEDVLVIWNRYGGYHEEACRFEAAGARVVVVENGYLGKGWRGGDWYAMALGHHSGAGIWPVGGPQRWAKLGVELAPWRDPAAAGDLLVLGQRGIGEPGLASPQGWAEAVQRQFGGRIRPHPRDQAAATPLERDLAGARAVLTWHSAGALHALLAGVPVFYGFPRWIGAGAARPLWEFDLGPLHGDRQAMFERLIWAQWTLDEIAAGDALAHLLSLQEAACAC